jgi:hypothetical protein
MAVAVRANYFWSRSAAAWTLVTSHPARGWKPPETNLRPVPGRFY